MGLSAQDLSDITQGSASAGAPISASDLMDIVQQPAVAEQMPWSTALARGVANVPSSAIQFGQNLYQAASHPFETAKNVLDLGAGMLRNIEPKQLADWIDKIDWNPEAAKRASTLADQVGSALKQKYGSSEGFKKAFSEDPVGVMSDASTLLTGASGVLGMAGKVSSTAAKAGEIAATAGKMTNPLEVVPNAAIASGKNLLGMTTGVGAENITNAFKAGQAGDQGFLSAMRGTMPWDEPLNNAKANLSVMKQNRGDAYRSGMMDISGDNSLLNFKDIDSKLADAQKIGSYKGQTLNQATQDYLHQVSQAVDDWKNLDPAEFHTPEGFDALKQKVGGVLESIPFNDTQSRKAVGTVYNGIKQAINKQAPTYSKVMQDYSEASDQISEIERALSLGDRASADTAMRKLQSLTRNNVNTNYGGRLSLAQQLEQEGGHPFISQLSGQALNSPIARGLAGSVEHATVAGSVLSGHPEYAGLALLQSPRTAGEILYGAGRVYNPISQLINATGVTPAKTNALVDILRQQNQQ